MKNTFSFQPETKGKEISIRPLYSSDFDGLFACANDKKLWEGHPAKDRYKPAEFEIWFENAMNSGSTIVVVDNATNKLIGSSRYYVEESEPNDISIGFTFLDRNYWGGTTNSQLKELMLTHAFKHFSVVWFHVSPSNIRSQKATVKIGGVLTDEKNSNLSGKSEPWLFYKIEKPDWLGVNTY